MTRSHVPMPPSRVSHLRNAPSRSKNHTIDLLAERIGLALAVSIRAVWYWEMHLSRVHDSFARVRGRQRFRFVSIDPLTTPDQDIRSNELNERFCLFHNRPSFNTDSISRDEELLWK